MEISATVTSSASTHDASVRTGTASQSLVVPAKATACSIPYENRP